MDPLSCLQTLREICRVCVSQCLLSLAFSLLFILTIIRVRPILPPQFLRRDTDNLRVPLPIVTATTDSAGAYSLDLVLSTYTNLLQSPNYLPLTPGRDRARSRLRPTNFVFLYFGYYSKRMWNQGPTLCHECKFIFHNKLKTYIVVCRLSIYVLKIT